MYKLLLCVLLLLFSDITIIGQNNVTYKHRISLTDSLINHGHLDDAIIHSDLIVTNIRQDLHAINDSTIYFAFSQHARILINKRQLHKANEIYNELITLLSVQEELNIEFIYRAHCEIAYNFDELEDSKNLSKEVRQILALVDKYGIGSTYVKAYIETLKGMDFIGQNKISEAKGYLSNALTIYEHSIDSHSVEMLRCMDHLALCQLRDGNFDEAIDILLNAEAKINKKSGDNFNTLSINTYNLATIYSDAGYSKKAIEYFSTNIDAIKKREGPQSIMLPPNYINLSVLYNRMNLKQRAIHYLELSEQILVSKYDQLYYSLGYVYANLTQINTELKDFELAKQYAEKAEKVILHNWGKTNSHYAMNLVFKAQLLAEMGELPKAYEAMKEANILLRDVGMESPRSVLQCRLQELVYMIELGNTHSAESQLVDLYNDAASKLEGSDLLKVKIDEWLCRLNIDHGDYVQAVYYNDRALSNLLYDFKSNNYKEATNVELLLILLRRKNEINKDTATASTYTASLEKEITRRIIEIFHYQLRHFDDELDRSRLKLLFFDSAEEILNNYYWNSINTPNDFDVEGVFELLQLYKNIDHTSEIKFTEKEEANFSMNNFIKADRQIHSDVRQLKNKLANARLHINADTSQFLQLRDSLIKVMDNRTVVLEQLRKEQPRYYGIKYGKKIALISDIKNHVLHDDDLYIEYFIGNSAVYQLAISKHTVDFFRVPITEEFETIVFRWLENLKSPTTQINDLMQDGQRLYDILLTSILTNQIDNKINLKIVNDGVTNYIPFELLTPTQTKDTFSFLLEHKSISYYVSSSLAVEQSMQPTSAKASLSGFAINYATERRLADTSLGYHIRGIADYVLPETVHEVTSIKSLVGGDIYINDRATESIFKRIAQQSNILHLSVHGEYNNDEPMQSTLVFSSSDSIEDGLLNTAEIYNLNLNVDMAVLSACETGLGELRKGEGIMGISRAFSHAGARSNVVSLWKVPDHATSKIMQQFYQELKEGKRKDEALRNAKLHYLDQVIEPELKHPFYWAGFILQGNTQPLSFQSNVGPNLHWPIAIASLAIIIGLFGLWYRRNKNIE